MARAKAEGGESNMGMVRAAIEELGEGAKPLEIQKYIQEKYSKELPTQIISNYKFQINKKKASGGKGAGTGHGRGRTAAASAAGGLQVADFQVIRGLVGRLGADQVKALIDVIG
jgi:ribosomal protein L19E